MSLIKIDLFIHLYFPSNSPTKGKAQIAVEEGCGELPSGQENN